MLSAVDWFRDLAASSVEGFAVFCRGLLIHDLNKYQIYSMRLQHFDRLF